MPAVQIFLSGEGSIFYFSFEVLPMCTLWQAWAKSYCLLRVRWSLEDGGKVGAGLIPGVSFFPCVWKWMLGTITVLWMQALKQPMAEEWHGRNGESDLLFATAHLWLVHCRLKTFLIKQQTSSLYHSCSLFQAVLGQPHRVHFFFPYFCVADVMGKKAELMIQSWSCVTHRPFLHHLPLQLDTWTMMV